MTRPYAYDALEHIAKALHFDRWRQTEFALLTVYGDAGGSAVQPNEAAQLVAGFLGNTERWIEFKVEWDGFLVKHGLKSLHMTELSPDPEARKPILDDAIKIITKRDYNLSLFVNMIDSEDFRDYQAKHGTDPKMTLGKENHAYPFAAMVHIAEIEGYCKDNRIAQPTEWIYEAGDPFQNPLKRAIVARGYPEPMFRKKSPELRPLEACDFVAYEFLHGYRNGILLDERRGVNRPQRQNDTPYLWAFWDMPGRRGIYTRDNLYTLRPFQNAIDRIEAAKAEGEKIRNEQK